MYCHINTELHRIILCTSEFLWLWFSAFQYDFPKNMIACNHPPQRGEYIHSPGGKALPKISPESIDPEQAANPSEGADEKPCKGICLFGHWPQQGYFPKLPRKNTLILTIYWPRELYVWPLFIPGFVPEKTDTATGPIHIRPFEGQRGWLREDLLSNCPGARIQPIGIFH